MNRFFNHGLRRNYCFLTFMFLLSSCTLNVNLTVATEKPIALNVAIDKPIEVKLGADVAITKLPPIQAQAEVKLGIAKSPPVKRQH